ncbi:MAG: hypothetical protein JW791_04690 [Nanoarchaeota archaeon]|nr:hypothetical protein [Nanoarchaeota archaeon]
MTLKDSWNRFKTGIKIAFNKKSFDEFSDLQKYKLRLEKTERKVQNKIPAIMNFFNDKYSIVADEYYKKGRQDVINFVNGVCGEGDAKPNRIIIDDLLDKVDELHAEYDIIKKTASDEDMQKLAKKNATKLFSVEFAQVKSYFKGETKSECDKMLNHVCLCTTNFYLMSRNFFADGTAAIIDTNYVSRVKEFNSGVSLTPKNIEGCSIDRFIIPHSVCTEIRKTLKYDANKELKEFVKSVLEDLLNPGNIIVPDLNAKKFLPKDLIERFTKENGELHKADLEIIYIYKKFGDQFKTVYLLSDDSDLIEYMKELSEQTHKNLVVKSSNKGSKFNFEEYYSFGDISSI